MTDASAETGQGLLTRDAMAGDPRLREQEIQRRLEFNALRFRQDMKTESTTRGLLKLVGVSAIAAAVLLGPIAAPVYPALGALLVKLGVGGAAATAASVGAAAKGILAGTLGSMALVGVMGAGLSNIGRGVRAAFGS